MELTRLVRWEPFNDWLSIPASNQCDNLRWDCSRSRRSSKRNAIFCDYTFLASSCQSPELAMVTKALRSLMRISTRDISKMWTKRKCKSDAKTDKRNDKELEQVRREVLETPTVPKKMKRLSKQMDDLHGGTGIHTKYLTHCTQYWHWSLLGYPTQKFTCFTFTPLQVKLGKQKPWNRNHLIPKKHDLEFVGTLSGMYGGYVMIRGMVQLITV